MTDRQFVRKAHPDARVDKFVCVEGCSHYRVVRPQKNGRSIILGLYEDTPKLAWTSAANRLWAQKGEGR